MAIILTTEQAAALDDVAEWYKNPKKKQVYRLYGSAGTGKTTIATYMRNFARVAFMTLSGKAALVMRSKGCEGASTIHSSIYKVEDGAYGEPEFYLNPYSEVIAQCDLICVDEVSMVGTALGQDLESFGKPILVLGDPMQLQPVDDEAGYFTSKPADFTLTQVRRQALDSPVLTLAYQALELGYVKPGKYGDSEVLSSSAHRDAVKRAMIEADQVLCGKRVTRANNCVLMRRWAGREGNPFFLPVPGDRLICLKNNHRKGILNGEQFEFKHEIIEDLGKVVVFEATSLDSGTPFPARYEVPWEFFEGTDANLSWHVKRNFDQFTYANCMTTHKAQGSQWNSVTIIDESGAFREQKRNHLYTAITRAAEKVIIL